MIKTFKRYKTIGFFDQDIRLGKLSKRILSLLIIL